MDSGQSITMFGKHFKNRSFDRIMMSEQFNKRYFPIWNINGCQQTNIRMEWMATNQWRKVPSQQLVWFSVSFFDQNKKEPFLFIKFLRHFTVERLKCDSELATFDLLPSVFEWIQFFRSKKDFLPILYCLKTIKSFNWNTFFPTLYR